MVYRGTVKNGKVELEAGADVPDGTLVNVMPVETETYFRVGTALPGQPDPADDLLSEAVSTGITDHAAQHHHSIYGTPKRPE